MAEFEAIIELSTLDGITGFRLGGPAFDRSGWPVASAGDSRWMASPADQRQIIFPAQGGHSIH